MLAPYGRAGEGSIARAGCGGRAPPQPGDGADDPAARELVLRGERLLDRVSRFLCRVEIVRVNDDSRVLVPMRDVEVACLKGFRPRLTKVERRSNRVSLRAPVVTDRKPLAPRGQAVETETNLHEVGHGARTPSAARDLQCS